MEIFDMQGIKGVDDLRSRGPPRFNWKVLAAEQY